MSIICPCCGQTTNKKLSWNLASRTFEANGEAIILSQRQAALFDILWRKKPANGREELAAMVYADDPDGGPENAAWVLSVMLNRMRRRLQPLGYTISRNDHSMKGWRLERIAA